MQDLANVWFDKTFLAPDATKELVKAPSRRLGSKNNEGEATLARDEDILGPLGVRLEELTGHVTIASDSRNRLRPMNAFMNWWLRTFVAI